MDIRKLNDDLSASPEIAIADMGENARRGFKSTMPDRPDNEEPSQPPAASPDIALFATVVSGLPKPILAFCRSSTRAATLWAFSDLQSGGVDTTLAAAKSAGYDLEGLRPRLITTKDASATQPEMSTCDN
jgi:sulfide:quinone oxidoreductase